MASEIYRSKTYQYNGPVLDPYLYSAPFLLSNGQIVEPLNEQWMTDPSFECTPEKQRYNLRNGVSAESKSIGMRQEVVAYQYRPFN